VAAGALGTLVEARAAADAAWRELQATAALAEPLVPRVKKLTRKEQV